MSPIFKTVCSLYYKQRQLSFTSYETAVVLVLLTELKVSLERSIMQPYAAFQGHFLARELRAVTGSTLNWYEVTGSELRV